MVMVDWIGLDKIKMLATSKKLLRGIQFEGELNFHYVD